MFTAVYVALHYFSMCCTGTESALNASQVEVFTLQKLTFGPPSGHLTRHNDHESNQPITMQLPSVKHSITHSYLLLIRIYVCQL